MRTKTVALWAGIATAVVAIGCSSGSSGDRAAGDTGAAPTTVSKTAEAKRPAASFTAADIKLKVRDTSNQCFGSAGCHVEYVVRADVDRVKLEATGRSWLVTYEISGVEDGPIVASFTLNQDGSYESYEMTGAASTTSHSKVLTAKVTTIEAQ